VAKWRGRRRKQLPETRGCCKLEKEALGHTLWGIRFGTVYGRVVRLTTGMNE
jgi:hypothetical protein